MYITPIIYNTTQFSWDRVKNHLNGIWHNTNTSLDLRLLHQEIRNMANAPPLDVDIAKQAKSFIDSLRASFPSMTQWSQQILGLVITAIGCGIVLLALMYCLKCGLEQMSQLRIQTRKLQLRQDRDLRIL